MHSHSKILLLLIIAVCSFTADTASFGQTSGRRAKLLVQQDQQPSTEEQSPPPEPFGSDPEIEQAYDSTYVEDDVYAEEEEANSNPFPEIVTAPVRKPRNISQEQWAKMTSDDAFRYEEPQEKKPKKNANSNWWNNMVASIFEFLASGVGNYIIIGIVVLIVLIIVIRIVQLNGNIFFSKKDKKLTLEKVDESSDEFVPDDWEKVIQEAAAAGNYRLAVRHGYRYLLSLLQQKEMINYQVAKTNYQYVFELSGTQLHRPFMQLTRDYEYAWYGGFNIQQDRFEEYYRKVSDLKKELDQKG